MQDIYRVLYSKVPGVRYDILSTMFSEDANGVTTGFVEVHLVDDVGQNNVKGVFRMEADGGKIRSGRLYMTPVQEEAGNIHDYVAKLSTAKKL